MSVPFKHDIQSVFLENEFFQACKTSDGEIPRPQSSCEAEDDDIHYLQGKLFFDIILAKSHLPPFNHLYMPARMVQLLPRATIPVVLRHGGKNWNLSYKGDFKTPKFDPRWKTFVTENHLKVGDACVFELMDKSRTKLRFKVHILRLDNLPNELLELIESHGQKHTDMH